MDKPTIKILMLKGEKGDAYDDSELRAEIEATLANNAYVQFIGDGELELPVHSINDSVTSNTSTWSSNKIVEEYPEITYTINGDNITCNKTYNDISSMSKVPIIRILNANARILADNITFVQTIQGCIIEGKTYDGKIKITHRANNTITVTFISDEDIRRIKFVEVETTDGRGDAYFTCETTPHILGITIKGSSGSPEAIQFSLRSTDSVLVYPRVYLVDDTSNVANRYGLVVDTKETSGTSTVIVSIAY